MPRRRRLWRPSSARCCERVGNIATSGDKNGGFGNGSAARPLSLTQTHTHRIVTYTRWRRRPADAAARKALQLNLDRASGSEVRPRVVHRSRAQGRDEGIHQAVEPQLELPRHPHVPTHQVPVFLHRRLDVQAPPPSSSPQHLRRRGATGIAREAR